MTRLARRRLPIVLAAVALAAAALGARGDDAPAKAAPVRPEEPLVENVEVNLVQFDVLVTDKKGRAVTDLKPDEVEILEGGTPQKLAFLERASAGRRAFSEAVPRPSKLYGGAAPAPPAEAPAVAPPIPTRRILFAFDVRNSKMNARKAWRDAALLWVRAAMGAEDRAGVVLFRTYPEWVQPMTATKADITSVLESLKLESEAPDRDRRQDMTKLVSEVDQACSDYGRTGARGSDPQHQTAAASTPSLGDSQCAVNIAKSYAQQWDMETTDTLNVLRTLTGQLAAIPGRKMLLLFSDGFVPDAGALAGQAVLGLYGTDAIDQTNLAAVLRRDQIIEVNQLFEAAKAGGVSVFTFDSRSGTDGTAEGMLERGSMMSSRALSSSPWTELQTVTRDSLESLARETGGRAYSGKRALEDNLFAAADSFFGIYTVGYYRNPGAPTGKLRIRISRKGVVFDLPEKANPWSLRTNPVVLDVSVGQPRMSGPGRQRLPLKLQVPYSSLPLRPGGGGWGCLVGLYVQAIRPDGTVVAELLETDTAAITKDEHRSLEGRRYEHVMALDVPAGPYRVVARLSDDRQDIVGERAIDLTVGDGTVKPGLDP